MISFISVNKSERSAVRVQYSTIILFAANDDIGLTKYVPVHNAEAELTA